MENSQPLATESFSYSWLTHKNPQNSYDDDDTLSENPNQNFNFPLASPQTAPVHADEIFSGGHIMPVYIDASRIEAWRNSHFAPPSSPPLVSSYSPGHRNVVLIEKLRNSSRKRFLRLCGFLKALIGCSRKSNRVDDFERVEFEASPNMRPSSVSSGVDRLEFEKVGFYSGVKMVNKSLDNSPRMMSPSCSGNYSWSCDVESSIHEAILYCKKSIEK